MTFTYKYVHLPSGKICFGSTDNNAEYKYLTTQEFYDLLCRWNAQSPNIWVYAPISEGH